MVVGDNIANNYHVYSMNWSPNQISFLVDNVEFYTYSPSSKNASNWPFNSEQYILLNIAMEGVAGPIASNFTQTAMVIDYVRVYQNTTPDIQKPTNFTASVGNIAGSAVELLLKANDDSGNVTYNVTYGNNGTASTFSPSGVQKSLVISGLLPNTDYTFSVSASDASGNTFINNPIELNAKTTVIQDCSGTDTEAQQGSFSLGYKYNFETIGTEVKITFELLDSKVGLVAFLKNQSSSSEPQMTNVSGQIFTRTISGQTIGSTINYAVKFAYASGGLAVTKYISYVVGSGCSLGVETSSELKQFYYPNPVENNLYLQLLDDQNQIILTDILGRELLQEVVKSSHNLDMSAFKSGIYFLRVKNSDGVQNMKIIKK
jgi:hypothetical protein